MTVEQYSWAETGIFDVLRALLGAGALHFLSRGLNEYVVGSNKADLAIYIPILTARLQGHPR